MGLRHLPSFSPKAPEAEIIAALSDSARDFQAVVWPQVAALPLVGGGTLRPVEAVAATSFKDELDLLACWRRTKTDPPVRVVPIEI